MRRIFALEGQVVMRDVDAPTPRWGEVLVETHYSTVSIGTETYILRRSAEPDAVDSEYPGTQPWPHPRLRAGIGPGLEPRTPLPGLISIGYSVSGVVRAVGEGVTDLAPGDRVACSGSQCAHHADVVAVPRNLTVRVPDEVSLADASFGTLGTIAQEAIRRTECHVGETVVIYGLGLLGILAAQIARVAGLYVIGLEIDPERREHARGLGFDEVHDPAATDIVALARERTEGFGADAAILGVVTESSEPFNASLEMTRQRGRVVSLGIFGMSIERSKMFDRSIVHSLAYGPGRYDPGYEEGNADMPIGLVRWTENRNMGFVQRLLSEGRLVTEGLARTVPFDEAPAAYAAFAGRGLPYTLRFDYGHGSD